MASDQAAMFNKLGLRMLEMSDSECEKTRQIWRGTSKERNYATDPKVAASVSQTFFPNKKETSALLPLKDGQTVNKETK